MKLVDTSVVVDIDRGGVDDRVGRLDEEGRHAISVVTLTELRLGVNHGSESETPRQTALQDLATLTSRFDQLDVTRPVAEVAADLIAELAQRGAPPNDLRDLYIAATAMTEQLPVLTANVDHFSHIDGIEVVEWASY